MLMTGKAGELQGDLAEIRGTLPESTIRSLSDANKQKTLLVLKSIVLYFIFRRFAMCRIFVFLVRSLEFLALFTKVLL